MPADEAAFLWEEANNSMFRARTPEDFQAAAEAYRGLAEAGVRNGYLFYNLGTAQALGQRYDDAVESLLRAERFMGSSPEIRRNMLLALEGKRGENGEGVDLAWYRPLLFWHYGLATRTRVTIALAAFAVFWALISLRVLGIRGDTARLAMIAVAVAIVFGSSAATSLQQDVQGEHDAEMREQLMEKTQ